MARRMHPSGAALGRAVGFVLGLAVALAVLAKGYVGVRVHAAAAGARGTRGLAQPTPRRQRRRRAHGARSLPFPHWRGSLRQAAATKRPPPWWALALVKASSCRASPGQARAVCAGRVKSGRIHSRAPAPPPTRTVPHKAAAPRPPLALSHVTHTRAPTPPRTLSLSRRRAAGTPTRGSAKRPWPAPITLRPRKGLTCRRR